MIKKQLTLAYGIMVVFLLSGCAIGYLTSYTSDPNTGKSTKTVYSPLFSSESLPLAEGAKFGVSAVNTRKVEPLSYYLLGSIGGLGANDLDSKGTAVVHFKNDSQQSYTINLKKIVISEKEFIAVIPEIVLKPTARFSTKEIAIKVPTYDTGFNLDLFYELNGKSFSQKFQMKRQKIEEVKKKK